MPWMAMSAFNWNQSDMQLYRWHQQILYMPSAGIVWTETFDTVRM